ncbi:MAG TPA: PQQ-dependent sugar dehydrogenase [Gaiellaceae bacterium]|nr:PQQ-dependent sugar dehydrogenase [Gaiellaceae bacterium]
MRRTVIGTAVLALAILLPATARAAVKRKLVGNFNAPIQVVAPPKVPGSTLYIAEKDGRVIRWRAGNRSVVLDIHGKVSGDSEQGLLSIAFKSGRVMFVYYTNRSGDSRVVRYNLGRGGGHVNKGSRRTILRVDQPFPNHNGGTLQFHGGHLYLSLGDGGSGCDPGERAQDPGTRLGKLLRRDKSGWKIVGYGLRNPWRWSFDRKTGGLYIGDVGQGTREEVDFLPAAKVSLPAENFGWDRWEGTVENTCENTGLRGGGELVFPKYNYGRSVGFTVIGGFVYRGRKMAGQRGRYFFGDLSGWVRTARAGTLGHRRKLGFQVPSLVSFGENSKGELYAVSLNGPVYRLHD